MNNSFHIDSITWNDLSMEKVYDKLNKTESSVGQEYLKKILSTLLMDKRELEERSARADYLKNHKDVTESCRKEFKKLGRTKKISLYDYIFRFNEIKQMGNGIHYLMILLLLAAIALIFIQPVIGILGLVVMFIVNISTYFKYKSGIEGYFMCFKYIVRMTKTAVSISGILEKETAADRQAATTKDKAAGNSQAADSFTAESQNEEIRKTAADRQTEEIGKLAADLKSTASELSSLKKGSWLLTNSVSGSLVDVVMDYVRMLFHVDIIRFNSMRKTAAEKTEAIDRLFGLLGELESDICIAMLRNSETEICIPELSEFDCGRSELHIKGMCHPLTDNAVVNDISTVKSVLLTGSNASGKSTFLKQLAINQIFAQTIYTCLASEFRSGFFKVISSMALADNILGSESYFIVEIKSLKRIFDEIKSGDGSVMCFIDEVLRGTNTKERIAASSQILKKMSGGKALLFAATHDIELTEMLKDDMDNYHFEEYVKGNDVEFDYKIKKGPATTRNAILLMKAMGFDEDIIDGANSIVDSI